MTATITVTIANDIGVSLQIHIACLADFVFELFDLC